jgi:hypothetical protein
MMFSRASASIGVALQLGLNHIRELSRLVPPEMAHRARRIR